jgi:hypothetical protein
MTGQILLFPIGLISSQESASNPGRQCSKQAAKQMTQLQWERIAWLLDELEEIVGPDRDVLALRHRLGVDRARRFVRQLAGRTGGRKKEPEGDPQPYIDHQVLERIWALDSRD